MTRLNWFWPESAVRSCPARTAGGLTSALSFAYASGKAQELKVLLSFCRSRKSSVLRERLAGC